MVHVGGLEVGAPGTHVKNRQGNLGRERPAVVVRTQQIIQVRTDGTSKSGERDPREESGTGRTDVGIGCQKPVFGHADVRTVQQHVG